MITTIRQALHLIGREYRSRWIIVLLLAIVTSLVEIVAAALVYVLIAIVANPSGTVVLPIIGNIRTLFGGIDQSTLLLYLVWMMIVFFLIRAFIAMGCEYVMARVVMNAAARLSVKLTRGYLELPYSFHLQRNSSELIRNAHEAVLDIVNTVFSPLIRLTAEVVVCLGILALLVVISPLGTGLAVVVVGGPTVVLTLIVQPRLRRYGGTAHALHKDTLGCLQQSLQGVRDIKVLGREEYFAGAYGRSMRRLARMLYINTTLYQLPRLVIETSLVWFILIYFGIAVTRGSGNASALSILGLFGYAGLRLQPSLQKIAAGFNSIKFSTVRTEDIYRDLLRVEESSRKSDLRGSFPFRDQIALKHVHFAYEGADREALVDADLVIKRGEQIGICGPTGGGKSTMVDIIVGLLYPLKGKVEVDGRDIAEDIGGWQKTLGVVPQSVFLIDDTLRKNIAFGIEDTEIDEAAVREAVELAQLDGYIAALPEGLDTVVGERGVRISGGERQRIAIARALYSRPEVLIFDEGTSALDNTTEQELVRALRRLRGTHTILLVAHRLSTVCDADKVVFIKDGKIAGIDTFQNLREKNETFRQMAAMS